MDRYVEKDMALAPSRVEGAKQATVANVSQAEAPTRAEAR